MGFRVLDDYPRRPIFEFYLRNPLPFFCVTFELDATRVRARARERERSVYAALVWAFHRAMLSVDAFRVRAQGTTLVLHDSLRVGLTVPAPGGFSFADLEWNDVGDGFLAEAAPAMARASERITLQAGGEPDFAYYTTMPQVPFTSLFHAPLTDPAAGQAQTAFGRISERQGREWVPVSLQVNHRYVDGADVGALYERARESFAQAF